MGTGKRLWCILPGASFLFLVSPAGSHTPALVCLGGGDEGHVGMRVICVRVGFALGRKETLSFFFQLLPLMEELEGLHNQTLLSIENCLLQS